MLRILFSHLWFKLSTKLSRSLNKFLLKSKIRWLHWVRSS
jgi:hypothetical protein